MDDRLHSPMIDLDACKHFQGFFLSYKQQLAKSLKVSSGFFGQFLPPFSWFLQQFRRVFKVRILSALRTYVYVSMPSWFIRYMYCTYTIEYISTCPMYCISNSGIYNLSIWSFIILSNGRRLPWSCRVTIKRFILLLCIGQVPYMIVYFSGEGTKIFKILDEI